MPGFVGDEREAVSLEEYNPNTERVEKNTIWIKKRMGFGSRERVKGAMFDLRQDKNGQVVPEVNFGNASVQLLKENVVDWEGPAFVNGKGKKVPVSSSTIEDLDPEWKLVDMVLERINDLNRSKSDEEEDRELKNLPTDGSSSLTEGAAVLSENTTFTS